MEDKVQNVILESEEINQWIGSKIEIENLQVNSAPRERASCACFSIAIQHHRSIVLLISKDLTGSACALLRPMSEACIRGLWLHHKASDEEVDKLRNKDIVKKPFDELIKEIETVPGYDAGVLSAVIKATWKAMNSYVHCGFLQIEGMKTATSIEPNYSDDLKVDVLKGASAYGLLSFLGMARLANNFELQKIILAKIKSLPRSVEFSNPPIP